MKKFYVEVANIYQQVNASLPSFEGNPCGECRSCCSVELSVHRVNLLELQALEERIGKERTDLFRQYIAREKDSQGEWFHPTCPLLDANGCSIHKDRPLSCRLYGHYRVTGETMLDHCVFKGTEKVIRSRDSHRLMPGNARLAELTIEFRSYFPPGEIVHFERKKAVTPVEKASEMMLDGNFAGAKSILERLMRRNPTFPVRQMMASTYGSLGEFENAIAAYRSCLRFAPDNPQLHYLLATIFFQSQRYEEALTACLEAQRLAPDNPGSIGLMGIIHTLLGAPDQAEKSLLEALSLETSPGPYRYHMGILCEQLGRRDEARHYFSLALEHEISREAAREALENLSA